MRQVWRFIKGQGFFLMIALCVLVVAASAVWAYHMRQAGAPDAAADAGADYAQRLSEAQSLRLLRPVAGETVRGFTGQVFLPTLGHWAAHEGLDLAAEGGEAVYAAQAGTVEAVRRDAQWGVVVDIRHDARFVTRYAGLSWPAAVAAGDEIAAGQRIGAVGGIPVEAADGAHLHFALLRDGAAVDPGDYTQ
ncbi:MAG: M23 family metallopeptidase [Oscillospiraceae bacterium]|jgi:murein DD-endopeptidase MepM/ murein hydrolase activator NlpD|nr:M23 family metallopeptidase [Oscillospiraceae bacterium]